MTGCDVKATTVTATATETGSCPVYTYVASDYVGLDPDDEDLDDDPDDTDFTKRLTSEPEAHWLSRRETLDKLQYGTNSICNLIPAKYTVKMKDGKVNTLNIPNNIPKHPSAKLLEKKAAAAGTKTKPLFWFIPKYESCGVLMMKKFATFTDVQASDGRYSMDRTELLAGKLAVNVDHVCKSFA